MIDPNGTLYQVDCDRFSDEGTAISDHVLKDALLEYFEYRCNSSPYELREHCPLTVDKYPFPTARTYERSTMDYGQVLEVIGKTRAFAKGAILDILEDMFGDEVMEQLNDNDVVESMLDAIGYNETPQPAPPCSRCEELEAVIRAADWSGFATPCDRVTDCPCVEKRDRFFDLLHQMRNKRRAKKHAQTNRR